MSSNNSTQPKKTPSPVVRAFALLCGALAATGFVAIAHATGHDSLAKGAVQGAAFALIVIAILWFAGPKFGLASRIANDQTDEREKLNTTKAIADAGIAMGVASVGGVIAGMYGMPGPLVAGAILWVGLLTALISIVIRTKRS